MGTEQPPIDRRAQPRIEKIETELEIINYKVDALTSSFDDIKLLITRQTDVISTFSVLQEKQSNLKDRVMGNEIAIKELAAHQTELGKAIENTRTVKAIFGGAIFLFLSAMGYWYSHESSVESMMDHRLTIIETQLTQKVTPNTSGGHP